MIRQGWGKVLKILRGFLRHAFERRIATPLEGMVAGHDDLTEQQNSIFLYMNSCRRLTASLIQSVYTSLIQPNIATKL